MFFLIKSVCYLTVLSYEERPISGAWVAGKPHAVLDTRAVQKPPVGPRSLAPPLSTLCHAGQAPRQSLLTLGPSKFQEGTCHSELLLSREDPHPRNSQELDSGVRETWAESWLGYLFAA